MSTSSIPTASSILSTWMTWSDGVAETVDEALQAIRAVYREAKREFAPQPEAAPKLVDLAEKKLQFKFSPGLRDLWMAMNGASKLPLFCVDEYSLNGFHAFLPIEKAYENRNRTTNTWELHGGYPENCDPRIQFWYFEHVRWFPIGRMPLSSDVLYFDAAPGPEGDYGQIIFWSDTEDEISFIAPSIEALLNDSLTTMRLFLEKEPTDLQSMFDFYEVPRIG